MKEKSHNEQEQKGIQQPSLVPTLEFPKSGGAIQGIGEKYTANPATGTGNFSVPIGVTASRGTPQLSLSYSSGSGNGVFGLGWQMTVPSITRKTERNLPIYNDTQDSDTFILSGAEDLVKRFYKDDQENWKQDEFERTDDNEIFHVTRYSPRIEGMFARIEKWVNKITGDTHWRSVSGENVTSVYGETSESRIADPKNPKRIFSWLLCKSFDRKGNITVYEYKQEDNDNVPNTLSEVQRRVNAQPQKYLKRILYGNKEMYPRIQSDISQLEFLFQVVFDYGEHDKDNPTIAEQSTWPCRLDSFSKYRSGFEIRTRRLCKRILMFHTFQGANETIDKYGLGKERLIQSTDINYIENENITQINSITKVAYEKDENSYVKNEMPPLEFSYSKAVVNDSPKEIEASNARNTPQGLSGNYQFTDLNAEGMSGVLTETSGAWYYRRNLGDGRFDKLKLVNEKPNWSNLSGGSQLSNIESNGQLYLSQQGSNAGFSKREDDGSWSPFKNYCQKVNIDLSDPDIRYVDLNGDGRPEILILRDELLRWYPNNGEMGFDEEQRCYTGLDEDKGPSRIFQNDLEGIFLNDMTGDGLSDIVRIRCNEICYWPNLGYGNFGEKVTMDNIPYFESPDAFHPQNLRLADIDGSGTTDFLYLGGNKTHYWLNYSGNSFSDPIEIKNVPPTDKQITISLVDLLGNGTACLVWSSPLQSNAMSPWKYIDIMNSTKSYLLTEIRNNMGSVTRSEYKPSTYFYLKDENDGNPWVTKLPFPVHVVHKTEIEDLITGHRFVTEYAYHHGYYDREEREFRGFGCVEQFDDESFKNPDKINPNIVYDKPRVCTKSWFHTGAWEKEIELEEQYRSEYWVQENDETFLGVSELLDDANWNPIEVREAKRALRGQLLRTEIFAEDDNLLSNNPYVVTESRYRVKQLQPVDILGKSNKHAVYISLPLEQVTATYDRNPKDPRLSHEITLEIDDFGNAIKSVSITYPRLLTSADSIPEQYETKIIFTENKVFNQSELNVDWYTKGVPLSTKVYEIESLSQTQAFPPFFKREILLNDISTAPKKLLSAQVNYFRGDADNQADNLVPSRLNFGEVQSLLLTYGSYQLIFTDELLSQAYSGKLTQAEWEQHLTDENYLDEIHDNEPGWWVKGGFVQFDPNNFYTTTKATDAWGNLSEVIFDDIGLLPIKVIDPLGNEVTAQYDYRILKPLSITDPNGNKQEVAYDDFGRVIRTVVKGRNGEGDEMGINPRASFTESDTETSVIEYNHKRFYEDGLPNFVHSYTRETHHKDLGVGLESRWMESRVYSDGFGRELQNKAKVAPGEAKYVDVNGDLHTELVSDPRWLSSGRTVYDNKGQAVKQFEPYFSTTKEYEKEEHIIEWGVSPFIHYDPIGRVHRTDMPDGTYTKEEFSPWMSKNFDANDTILDSKWYVERIVLPSSDPKYKAAVKSAAHADTPNMQITDVLGRTVVTRTNNLGNQSDTRVILDTVGNQLQVIDANGNLASDTIYDLVGRPLKIISNDAGTTYSIMSIDNQPALTWIPNGHRTRMEYDQFRRAKYLWLLELNSTSEIIKEATIYGEEFSVTPETHNMRGQVWKSYDQAGVLEVLEYDFKGSPLMSSRSIFDNYLEEGNWTDLTSQTPNLPLTSESFAIVVKYDALGRPIESTAPDGSITKNEYDEGGTLLSVRSKIAGQAETIQVEKITYNEKGQRLSILYGNNVRTKYSYDSLSYRLTNIHSQKDAHLNGDIIQNVDYTYDAVGNIVELFDKAQQTIFFANQVVQPKQKFVYDGLNRLIEAKGREHIGQNTGEQLQTPLAKQGAIPYNNAAPNDTNALQSYTQKYTYDKVGNIEEWKHNGAPTTSFTRYYTYQNQTNRMVSTQIGNGNTTTYSYDPAGNIEQLSNHITPIQWNFENQPTFMDFGASKKAHYRYDQGGERIRKVIILDGTRRERIYLGSYEVYREINNNTNQVTKERSTLHISDDIGKVCIVETLTKDTSINSQLNYSIYRFQLSNHLGSVGIELDYSGSIISYEEYHPYGTTSFYWRNSGISQKQYRYTGKERDEESGLSYHSARYYLPWLGRWLSADPAGMVDGPCLYQYSLSSPVMLSDENGMQSQTDKYTIEKGDTYVSIASRSQELFGRTITVEELKEWNPNLDWKKLQIGSEINIGRGSSEDTLKRHPHREIIQMTPMQDARIPNLRVDSLFSPEMMKFYSTVTIIVELPNPNDESKLSRMGLGGHTAIAIDGEFYDFGPAVTQRKNGGYRVKGAGFPNTKGAPWNDGGRENRNPDILMGKVENDELKILDDYDYSDFLTSDLPTDQEVWTIEIKVTQGEKNKLIEYWDNLYRDLPNYSIWKFGLQCTSAVRKSLKHSGIYTRPNIGFDLPANFLRRMKKKLKSTYPSNNLEPQINQIVTP
ncbi:MAG: LysM peptidoglycan-binding domain-containing protein [Flavobacteriales bacterium]|nr:LysM peptidoglycan-binding domain-containing protein [Flavobacteriales bacterium]